MPAAQAREYRGERIFTCALCVWAFGTIALASSVHASVIEEVLALGTFAGLKLYIAAWMGIYFLPLEVFTGPRCQKFLMPLFGVVFKYIAVMVAAIWFFVVLCQLTVVAMLVATRESDRGPIPLYGTAMWVAMIVLMFAIFLRRMIPSFWPSFDPFPWGLHMSALREEILWCAPAQSEASELIAEEGHDCVPPAVDESGPDGNPDETEGLAADSEGLHDVDLESEHTVRTV
eukprot:m.14784 g.14784  ORF g.14784 m.14784 type:complete len:231 (-) comp2973_c1_seq1:26-718(-)